MRRLKSELIEEYLRWNGVLTDAVYPEIPSASPAYLSLDTEQRSAAAAGLGLDIEVFESSLARCVRGVLNLDGSGPTDTYRTLNLELGRWKRLRKAERGAPPVLPLLALLTVAAERMATGDGMAETNFYGRACEVLEHRDDRRHFEQGYRMFGERYWSALDRWLEDNDGLRGLPTAVAVGHRFVGLPISQVLIREADRDRLPQFFIYAGFPPGAAVPPKELEPAFDRWMASEPCPASPALLHQWHSSGKQRILESVAAVLATWNGHIVHREGDDALLQASLALNIGQFPRPRIEFSPIAYLANADEARDGEIKTDRGWEPVDLAPFATGIMRIGDQQAFDNTSLLEGILEVRDSLSGRSIGRSPRRVMIFRRVDHAGAYLEAEQTMLGEDVVVVVRNQPVMTTKVEKILQACARPGWGTYPEGYGGIPVGWTVYHSVQILSNPGELVPNASLDLRALVPLTNSQLLVSGGLGLPGSVRGKWHRLALPEVRAVSDDPNGFTVRLFDLEMQEDDEDPMPLSEWRKRDAGALVIALSEEELEDGNYRVELQPAGSAQAVSAITIRVRSGDRVDAEQLAKSDPVDQFLDDPLSVLSASEVVGERSVVGGLVMEPMPAVVRNAHPPASAHWKTGRSERRKLTLAIATVPPDSCLYTGSHHTAIETVEFAPGGRPLTPYVVGKCSECGLQRRFPSTSWQAKRRSNRGQTPQSSSPARMDLLPQITNEEKMGWDVALDGFFHCGAGTPAAFERLAAFLEPSALMVHHLTRTLSSLGHIELMRDAHTFELKGWEVGPSVLVPTSRGWFLTGHWPSSLVKSQLAADPGLTIQRYVHPEAPTSRFFNRFPEQAVDGVQEGISAIEFAAQLPVLSQVIDALPRVSAPARATGLSVFDPASAKWQDTENMALKGGYRMRSFATLDLLRSQDDLDRGTMAVSTVHLSKHATALLWGAEPLLAYDEERQVLTVPLGTNLPGLYERAAVLASGLAPLATGGSLSYLDVSPELAGHITYLLSN
ncbi:hypothetical protein [Tessaracoccus sp. MC1756]|uniref:hypothetical protein n=1 Tax=Tessaracoccus sp. MC1756 TaxID=2760311 RepID=UPI00160009DC|nr:hypothetical protein [Tessaracoccus sp. MC1756]MBB1510287.1 hypothetical protein [Tessaracoccus sp. MC1756]